MGERADPVPLRSSRLKELLIMQRRRFLHAIALAATVLTVASLAWASLSNGSGNGRVRFRVKGPAGMIINGRGQTVKVSESGGTIKAVSRVSNLKTGISLRDDHLKDYIKAKDHPDAILTVERSALKFPEAGKRSKGTATGKLTLAGTTKDVTFEYKAKANKKGDAYKVAGDFEINIEDFGIEQPCYLGVCVEKTVKINVKFKAKD